jgi:hypothetical protein
MGAENVVPLESGVQESAPGRNRIIATREPKRNQNGLP